MAARGTDGVADRSRGGNAPSARIDLTPRLDPPPCDESPGEAEDVRDPDPHGGARRWGAPGPGSGGSPGGDQEEEDGEEDDAAGRDVTHDGLPGERSGPGPP